MSEIIPDWCSENNIQVFPHVSSKLENNSFMINALLKDLCLLYLPNYIHFKQIKTDTVGLVICPILGTSPMCFPSLFRSNSHLKPALNHISSTLCLPTLYYAKEVLITIFSMFIHRLMWFGWFHEKLIWLILFDNEGFVKWLKLQVHFQL